MARKSKYTQSQQKAYQSGMGYSVAHKGKKIEFTSEDLKQSFMAGIKLVLKRLKKSPKKYPNLK